MLLDQEGFAGIVGSRHGAQAGCSLRDMGCCFWKFSSAARVAATVRSEQEHHPMKRESDRRLQHETVGKLS
ncbi:hypothetical protein QWA68_000377 [Fusarium oxysporum]|nr:hypothetical protein QWA68_000377 [Fusarium oxysporum]